MPRLISADLLKARIEKARRDVCEINDDDDNWLVNLAADGMIKRIDETPTVEAEPVRHGNWKPFDEDEYTCSLCGNIFVTMDGGHPLSNGFKFCPFCGAKMDEREEE